MSMLALDLEGAEVLWPDGRLERGRLSLAEGRIVADRAGRTVDLSGYRVLPGIVDLHGDAFERHVAPRRGAMNDTTEGLLATEAELAANGITTAVLAQFWSWEGGLRGPDFAELVLSGLTAARPLVATDMRAQLRFEVALLDDHAALHEAVARHGVDYVVFNDHLPHARLSEGRRPPRLTGQALKAGRDPERHFEMMLSLEARMPDVPPALDRLCATLAAAGVRLGSHDDPDPALRKAWRARGAGIAEFPETVAAAEAAQAGGDAVVMGAPNLVRGGSHKGNASALDMVAMGLCDALASDYHYPSLRRAALQLATAGVCDFGRAWALISTGPARVLGLADRGALAPGLRADIVVLAPSGRIAATMAKGRVSYLSGEVAERFMA